MSVFAHISGRLQGAPVTRETRNGGRVTFFKMKIANGSTTEWWDCATFSETARAELEGLAEGDALSAVGTFTVEPWENNGKRGFNQKLTADRILALKPASRANKAKPRDGAESSPSAPADEQRSGTRPISREGVDRANEEWRRRNARPQISDDIPF